jgi:hypothetical protein
MTEQSKPAKRISDSLLRLCTSGESVSSLLAEDPTLAPGDAWEKLYGEHAIKVALDGGHRRQDSGKSISSDSEPHDELGKAAKCGKWGPTKPSELFLRV